MGIQRCPPLVVLKLRLSRNGELLALSPSGRRAFKTQASTKTNRWHKKRDQQTQNTGLCSKTLAVAPRAGGRKKERTKEGKRKKQRNLMACQFPLHLFIMFIMWSHVLSCLSTSCHLSSLFSSCLIMFIPVSSLVTSHCQIKSVAKHMFLFLSRFCNLGVCAPSQPPRCHFTRPIRTSIIPFSHHDVSSFYFINFHCFSRCFLMFRGFLNDFSSLFIICLHVSLLVHVFFAFVIPVHVHDSAHVSLLALTS